MIVWSGSLKFKEDQSITGLQLTCADNAAQYPVITQRSLEFLAFIETARVPFYLAVGPNLQVETSSEQSTQWFSKVLLHGETDDGIIRPRDLPDESQWFDTDQVQSVIGILARAQPPKHHNPLTDAPRVTEILFYAVKASIHNIVQPLVPSQSTSTPGQSTGDVSDSHSDALGSQDPNSIVLCALPLSSDLRYQPSRYSDLDLADNAEGHAQFLPSLQELEQRTQLTRKRDQLEGLFEGAPDRRKKAKRLRMESLVSETDARIAFPQTSAFTEGSIVVKAEDSDDTDALASKKDDKPQQRARALSRSPSFIETSTRPASSKGPPMLKRSSLSQLTTSETFEDTSVEARNKAAVSRTVMAGMRMVGLQQHRKREKRTSSVGSTAELLHLQALGQAAGAGHDANDHEYKAVYHQTYKGTLFAFRKKLTEVVLTPESIRDVVDRLLLIFCNDPP